MFFPHVCLCATCTPSALEGPKKTLEHLEPEFQKFVSSHLAAGDQAELSRPTVLILSLNKRCEATKLELHSGDGWCLVNKVSPGQRFAATKSS